MPATPTYPGVYIEEAESSVRPITGVATSVTAFVGYTGRGLDNRATQLFSFADFERAFGGLVSDSELSYAVQQFFLNGGSNAIVVRVPKSDAAAAAVTLEDGLAGGAKKALKLTALSKGAWANSLVADIDHGVPAGDAKAFNLTVTDLGTGTVERFADVTLDNSKTNYVVAVVNDPGKGSSLVRADAVDTAAGRAAQTGTVGGDITMSDIKNDKDYTLKISLDVPSGAVAGAEVTIVAVGESVPTSILGLGQLIERKLNLAIAALADGIRVRCVPSASGNGLRLWADVDPAVQPGAVDAIITLAAGTTNDIGATLKLIANTTPKNVARYRLGLGRAVAGQVDPVAGVDGTQLPKTNELIGSELDRTGIYALETVDLFNLLSIPDATRAAAGNPAAHDSAVDANSVYDAALAYCTRRRAFLLIDPPPEVASVAAAVDWISGGLTTKGANAAAYFPRLRLADPLDNFQSRLFAPAGVIAGVLARTDAARGVWKAPAGTEATLAGVRQPAYQLTDAENGVLNPLGLNCIRTFPVHGTVSWGARTREGADADGSQWKYVPVRRLALMIEESVYRGTQWAVFEPNDERLWGQLRLNLTSFMHGLFRQGAFQGASPRDAYLVKCDSETTTQDDIDRGIVNVVVGFAPLKPAEFVIIRIQQLAGQTQA